MRLSAIEITGFKSFASPTRIEFGEQITGIVGPNGSGKSNVADSIRWVLGEQSMKTLRGKKSEDIIFAGGPSRARAGIASVSLILTHDDSGNKKTHPLLDTPEIVITRQLTRAGDSVYLLNNRTVRLADVAEILLAAGFGQKTYTVIGQGTTDAFVNASPVERRAMFEDATGVTPLLRRKEQAERRLSQTSEHLARARDVLQELTPRLASLKRQASRARQHETVEKELKEYEEQWYSFHWIKTERRQKELAKQQEKVQIKIDALSEDLQNIQDSSTSISHDTHRLAELRKTYEDLHSREQEIAVALARVEGSSPEDSGLLEKEKELKIAEHKELLIKIDKQQDALASEEAELQKQRAALRTDSQREIKQRILHLIDLQDAFIDQIRGVRTMKDVADIRKEAEHIRTYTMETAGMAPDDTDDKGTKKILNACDQSTERITKTRITIASLTAGSQLLEARIAEITKLQKTKKPNKEKPHTPELDAIRKEREAITTETGMLEKRLLQVDMKQRETEKTKERIRHDMHTLEQNLHTLEIESARETARTEELQREMIEYCGKEFITSLSKKTKELGTIPEGLEQTIRRLRKKKISIGSIDPSVLEEEEEVSTRVQELQSQVDDLEHAKTRLHEGLRMLDRQIHEQFTSGMRTMNDAFSSAFRKVFSGGRAGLSVTKSRRIEHALPDLPSSPDSSSDISEPSPAEEEMHEHELPSGVEIRANPPGKKLSSLSQLSGGEKALTSIALLFAIISRRPSPFIVLDEVDATLDEENARRFSELLREFSKHTQFVIITHNRSTMESAGSLWGVTMRQDGTSHVLSVRLGETVAEQAPA